LKYSVAIIPVERNVIDYSKSYPSVSALELF
jgi:hypothetical protein